MGISPELFNRPILWGYAIVKIAWFNHGLTMVPLYNPMVNCGWINNQGPAMENHGQQTIGSTTNDHTQSIITAKFTMVNHGLTIVDLG